MRVVALDIDGVLATASSYRRAGPGVDGAPWTVLRADLAGNVQALCSAADASIVVSSAWRLLFPLGDLAGWLADVGLTARDGDRAAPAPTGGAHVGDAGP